MGAASTIPKGRGDLVVNAKEGGKMNANGLPFRPFQSTEDREGLKSF
jgi:hypothetical protein